MHKIQLNVIFLILFLTITTCYEYRTIDGSGNNKLFPNDGTPKSLYLREIPQNFLFGPSFQMIPTPGNYGTELLQASCADPLPPGNYPLPRCVSDKVAAMGLQNADAFNFARLDSFKSRRKSSHILTYWAFFVKMDIAGENHGGQNFPQGVYIPSDDSSYLSNFYNGPQNFTFTYTAPIPFNRSEPVGNYAGINSVTSFVDASNVYGLSEADQQQLRDYNNNGKMKLSYYDTNDGKFGYPVFDQTTGKLILGSKSITRNVFTDAFTTIFLREHNRLCDEFFKIHGNEWSDEQYFQEARRWVIAYIQKITYYEYIGTALGTPLPPYKAYDPNLRPGIDTFFATVTFRYGHSEISDFYNFYNTNGDFISSLSLQDVKIGTLISTFGVPSVALSMALQLQEEIDTYFSEYMRHFNLNDQFQDIVAIDIVRGRDHGVPLYNDARQAFGLKRKVSWDEISSSTDIQQRLKNTYASVDQVEALIGALAEDHYNGGNYGELIYTSFVATWTRIRDSDRFWYENKEVSGFSDSEINTIQTTRLYDIIVRNTPPESFYPQNLWFVQPPVTQSLNITSSTGYYNLPLADGLNMQWKITGSDVTFLFTVSSVNSWFGIGFNPDGPAMKGTDMMIFNNDGNGGVIGKNYLGIGRAVKPQLLPDDNQVITILGDTQVANGVTTIQVKRPLNAKNRKTLNGQIEMVYAWNLNSNQLSYHGGNRAIRTINLITGGSSGFINAKERFLLLFHGIVMFLIWGVLFPSSVWIVRYLRHVDAYMSQHRNLNLLGGATVAAFCAVSMSTVEIQASSPHGIMGIIVFGITGIQIALGLLAIWALANVESAATGIVFYLRHVHFYLGGALLLAAWANIYLGMIQYDTQFSGNGTNKPYIYAYTAWLVLFGLVITVSEFYYRIRNMQFLWPSKDTDDMNSRIRNCIPDSIFENLPAITWSEFNQRVMTGASLVIAEGLVFDVHKWIPIHPGGQKILKRVIGTDVTNDFFFDPSVVTVINKNFEAEYDEKNNPNSISVLTDNSYRMKTDQKDHAVKPYSVANAVDMINATAFKDKRVAMHRHTKFATKKLATMVVARIIDPVDNSGNFNPTSIPSRDLKNNQNIIDLQQPTQYSPNVFRRYILTNIESVSRSDAERPVKKFTFQVIHPKDRLPKFLPGDYIEIMSDANNHVVIRPYTPLQGPTENSFCILVKIYKDGAMSQHLNKQLRNFEVKVRGPFDIADRMVNISSPTLKPASIVSGPSSSSFVTGNDKHIKQRSTTGSVGQSANINYNFSSIGSNITSGYNLNNINKVLDGRSGILLNKEREDLCWDHLFMVCGGTGITPMLQLIQYHMDKAATIDSKFNLYLLNANDTIADLIQPQYLDYLCTVLKGKLRITYILSKPPPIWRGLSGQIDDSLLFDWIYQNYNAPAPPPAIPPRLSNVPNYGATGSYSNTRSYGKNQAQDFEDFEEVSEQSNIPPPQRQRRRQYEDDDDLYDPQYRSSKGGIPPPIQIPQSVSPPESHYSFNSQTLPYYFSPSNTQHTEMLLLNERHNYMRSLAMDNSNQVKLIVCGSGRFNDSIRKSLEKISFPIEEKASFIV